MEEILKEAVLLFDKIGTNKDQIILVSGDKLKELELMLEEMMDGGISYGTFGDKNALSSISYCGYVISFTTTEKLFGVK